jgi:bacteriorhodopsin
MSPARAMLRPMLLVLLLGLLVVCVKVVTGWWRGELSLAEDGNWLWLLLFPVLLVVWWRYFSVFGCEQPACLLPEQRDRQADK